MHDEVNQLIEEVYAQREEILRAFIAKYNCHPDEVMQIVNRDDSVWRVELVKKNDGVK